jgi:hypothetical protein
MAHDGDPPPTTAYADVVDKLGTIAAPLLGGFSITLIGLVVSKDASATIRWPSWSVAALTGATVLFLLAIQCTIAGRQFYVAPDEFKARTPELDEGLREFAYGENLRQFRVWADRARAAFGFGLALLLLGLIGVILPPGPVSKFDGGRWCALAIGVAALLGEVAWLSGDEWVSRQWNRRVRRIRSGQA